MRTETIPCLSLWQPWASLIAVGAKRIETRGWATNYRGPLAIHAAKRCLRHELVYFSARWDFCAALEPLGVEMGGPRKLWDVLPFGALVAVADLVDCRPTESFTVAELDTKRYKNDEEPRNHSSAWWDERGFGNYSPGRFGWVLEDVRPLKEPFQYQGRQGLFNIPAMLVHEVSR